MREPWRGLTTDTAARATPTGERKSVRRRIPHCPWRRDAHTRSASPCLLTPRQESPTRAEGVKQSLGRAVSNRYRDRDKDGNDYVSTFDSTEVSSTAWRCCRHRPSEFAQTTGPQGDARTTLPAPRPGQVTSEEAACLDGQWRRVHTVGRRPLRSRSARAASMNRSRARR